MNTTMIDKLRCSICGNGTGNRIYQVKERTLNRGDVFEYMHCPSCGTMSRVSGVDNMGCFYDCDYYAYRDLYHGSGIKQMIKNSVAKFIIRVPLPESVLVKYIQPAFPTISCLCGTRIPRDAAVLDVGGVRDYG